MARRSYSWMRSRIETGLKAARKIQGIPHWKKDCKEVAKSAEASLLLAGKLLGRGWPEAALEELKDGEEKVRDARYCIRHGRLP